MPTAVLGAELSRLNERHQELEDQYEAISIAVDALKAANSDIQTRFSPILSHRAGEIMAALTGGRYRKLLFDSNLSAEAEVFGESVARNVISLSRGTADQLYLALRLAISELVLPKDETCPLILDDALVNFDTPRMELAMDWLMKAAENRQIILFTCHDRESSYAKAHGKVNITNI